MGLFCEFLKFANLSSADFFHISQQIDTLCNFENLKICQTWIFLYFSTNWHIKRRLRPLCKFPKFAKISKFFFSEKFFYFDVDETCAKITVSISYIRFCGFRRSKLLQTWIFWYISTNRHIQERLRPFFNFENWNFYSFSLGIFFSQCKKIPIFKYFSMNWDIWESLRPILNIWNFLQIFSLKFFWFSIFNL